MHATDTNVIATTTFRAARHGDGAALWELVGRAGTLEQNSAYFYLLFAADFGDTCLIAEQDGETVGAVAISMPKGARTSAELAADAEQLQRLAAHISQGLGAP